MIACLLLAACTAWVPCISGPVMDTDAEWHWAQARSNYRQAYELALTPDMKARAANNLGAVDLQLGNYSGARKWFELSIQIHPGLSETWVNRGNLDLIMARQMRSRALALRAVDYYAMAVQLRPNDAQAWSNASLALEALGDTTASRVAREKAQWLHGN